MIRLSGKDAVRIADTVFCGKRPLGKAAAGTAHYGHIADAEGRLVDDVVATVFLSPHSYTGEDSVEISCHGSRYIVSEILHLLIDAGARMAKAGEFTSRAFIYGKMDLAQAEAVADMIASDSRASLALASTQMRGGYSAELNLLRDELLGIASLLELELDFSEEDVEFADRVQLRGMLENIKCKVDALRRSFSVGNAIKNGIGVAIVGRPNVGKSTLLNRLLGEQRAMVSDIAGTTRDAIEEAVVLDGVTFRFIDTAGIHATCDQLERMGIERTLKAVGKAQIVLQLLEPDDIAANGDTLQIEDMFEAANTVFQKDAGQPNETRGADDIYDSPESSASRIVIKVVNKIDSVNFVPLNGFIGISAKTGEGMDELISALRGCVDTKAVYDGDAVVSNMRHYEALNLASADIDRALSGMNNGIQSDLLSEEIHQILHHIGQITGEITSEDILTNIFSKFCIGK